MKKRIIAACCAAAAIAAGLYAIRASQMRLKEPVFLTHYIDCRQCSAGKTIMLNYVTDKSDDRSVVSVSFPECPELTFDVFDSETDPKYRYHKMRRVLLQSKLDSEEALAPAAATNAHVEFSDGTEGDFDIGQVIMENIPEPQERLVTAQNTGANNVGNSTDTMLALEDCTLTGITSAFDESCGAGVSITIDGGESSAPLALHKDDTVTFDAAINVSQPYVYNAYSLDQTLNFSDESGNIYRGYLQNIRYEPNFTESGIIAFLKDRGALD